MNGFLKPQVPLLVQPLRVERGEMLIDPGQRPELDRSAVQRCTQATHESRPTMLATRF